MSASLVGSEMCIRDSCNPGGPFPDWTRVLFGRSAEDGSPGTTAAGYRAVSYTHLTLPTICSV
eukprot:3101178-Alexandrium_andersonii.AAC.1